MNTVATKIIKRFNSSNNKTYDLNKHLKINSFPFLVNAKENNNNNILRPQSEHTQTSTFGQYNSLQSFHPKFRSTFVEKNNYAPRLYNDEDLLLVRKEYKNNNAIISELTPEELSLDPKFVNQFVFHTGEIKGKYITRLTTTNQKKIEKTIKLMRSNVMLSTRHKYQ
ncbi:hypothetical protein FOG51_02013 [Hanseniaspora uvarum]|uniref:Small ribosomal subunit protein bS18m n=1 Tax=Hanseniaspora uvarum TaxID=29833 RepID=A0A1E5RQ78_HANUV|nr:hypothetical protein FOG48_03462 [Hanseniaspora uvarum]KKA01178.1 hypothetical protein D499_0AM00250 [Hanseniaspora uvarum DSM 2768]KAF0273137.1 hypothetical protein FOG51_02013 [Hanseniaspora uvarum]KAF0277448.1 hypothetical protein FOG50_01730 [Hanseniaspora uvarum]OEJ88988.1 hypothetical protein AWRI3580_g1692 [Hanseniaspora uvarum]